MAYNNNNITEGQSINRPPFFDGLNYNYWKVGMVIYLKSINFELWDVVINDYTSYNTSYRESSEEEKKLAQLDAKGLNILFCAVNQEQFNRISNCKTSHEAWHNLEITHEGTNQVKETKINMLVHKYESFKMKPNEPISEMFTRFNEITNPLQSLGKGYSQSNLVRKILRSLTQEWEKKTMTIEEAKDLSNYPLEELMGNLISYEVQIKDKETEKGLNKKNIALNITTDSDEVEEEENEDIALLTRKFKRFIKNGKYKRNRKFPEKSNNKDETPLCYKCNKPGHIKRDCPLLKMKTFKKDNNNYKKIQEKGTWEDSDSSSDEESPLENEIAHMCFMA